MLHCPMIQDELSPLHAIVGHRRPMTTILCGFRLTIDQCRKRVVYRILAKLWYNKGVIMAIECHCISRVYGLQKIKV